MKIVIEVDKKSLEWLTHLIENSYNNTRKGVVNSNLFDSIPYIEDWHNALQSYQPATDVQVQAVAEVVKPVNQTKLTRQQIKEQKEQAKKEKEQAKAEQVYACAIHDKYHGLRSPRTDCDGCWELYGIRNGIVQAKQKRTAFQRKQSLKK